MSNLRGRGESGGSSSARKITDERLREVVRAGVGAEILSQTVQSAYDQSPIQHEASRRAKAEQDARAIMVHPVTGPILQQSIEDETDRYIQWVHGARCEKEGFWIKVGVHVAASLVIVAGAFIILFVAGLYAHNHPDSTLAQGADRAAVATLHTMEPETQSDAPSSTASQPRRAAKSPGN